MNKTRKKSIEVICEKLTELSELLGDIGTDEENYRDNMPENLQGGRRYEESEIASFHMQDAIECIVLARGRLKPTLKE
ncbi:hypothetical protein [Akkermansia muciniphila]|uniref:hypothetical protein n=1 Tax=Akkermansia muciniphila TaxID=239935 RepID=UPI00122EC4FA|nr:hypothetical protein [Akkermansia muciniphila]KAA3385215.1 hypothetical protein F1912_12215 [Akkermansia muciniphila]